jgi:hypothetical protein
MRFFNPLAVAFAVDTVISVNRIFYRSLGAATGFTPRLRFKTYDEMNAWLLDKCIAYAKAHHHPELTEQTIWEVFEAERPKLVPYVGRFDGFHAVPASVSKTCLVRFDNNKDLVAAGAVGRPVDLGLAVLGEQQVESFRHHVVNGSVLFGGHRFRTMNGDLRRAALEGDALTGTSPPANCIPRHDTLTQKIAPTPKYRFPIIILIS